MSALVSGLLVAATLLLWVPVAVFALECLMAARYPDAASRSVGARARRLRIAVVIPAHDEESVIGDTLAALRPQIGAGDRVIVVADNCTDRTGEAAVAQGAFVLTRNDATRRGKGYALDFAVQHLRRESPDAVIFLDADCRMSDGAVRLLAQLACAAQCPVQACNQIVEPDAARAPGIAVFAWLVRGTVRPTGLAAMGMPCQLYGTGMAFPWTLLKTLSLASDAIVEDMRLTIDLLERGRLPLFCRDARVVSELAPAPESANAQRRRWEHGHLATLVRYGVPAVGHALRYRDPRRLMLALDICVPPLSLLVMLLALLTIVSLAALIVLPVALYTSVALGAAWVALIASLVLAWRRFARAQFDFNSLLRIPAYAFGKLPMYLKFLTGRHKQWNRAARK